MTNNDGSNNNNGGNDNDNDNDEMTTRKSMALERVAQH